MFDLSCGCHPTRTSTTTATSLHRASRNEGYKGHATYVGGRKVCSSLRIQNLRNPFLYCISSSMSVSFTSRRASATLIYIIGDGVQMPGNRCSNCVSYSLKCTYIEASKVWYC